MLTITTAVVAAFTVKSAAVLLPLLTTAALTDTLILNYVRRANVLQNNKKVKKVRPDV